MDTCIWWFCLFTVIFLVVGNLFSPSLGLCADEVFALLLLHTQTQILKEHFEVFGF